MPIESKKKRRKANGQRPLAAARCSAATRPLHEVIAEIKSVFELPGFDGVTGFSMRMRTKKGNTVELNWGIQNLKPQNGELKHGEETKQ